MSPERAREALAGEWLPGMLVDGIRLHEGSACVRGGPCAQPPDTTDEVTVLAMVAVARRRLDHRRTEGDAHAWKRLEVAAGEWVGGWIPLADLAEVVVDVLEATR